MERGILLRQTGLDILVAAFDIRHIFTLVQVLLKRLQM